MAPLPRSGTEPGRCGDVIAQNASEREETERATRGGQGRSVEVPNEVAAAFGSLSFVVEFLSSEQGKAEQPPQFVGD